MNESIQIRDERDFWWVCLDICVMQDPDIPLSAKGIYAVLCTFASQRGDRTCFPKVSTIAKTAGCCVRTVQTALNRLESKGYVRRQARYRNKGMQSSSEYQIVGHRARKIEQSESGGANIAEPDGGANIAPRPPHILQTRTIATITTLEPTPSGGADAPVAQKPEVDVEQTAEAGDQVQASAVPSVMRETVELFLHKTGRSGITREELGCIRLLEQKHTPARVQREITTACDRFRRTGRDPSDLTFGYLWNALLHQRSYKTRDAPARRKARAVTAKDREEWGIR